MNLDAPDQTSGDRPLRAAWAEVDLTAIRENVAEIVRIAAPANVMAVVKADGYGHGSVAVARAAVDAGATWLGVALVQEGLVLRAAGVSAPILVLSEPSLSAFGAIVEHDLTPTVFSAAAIDALADAVAGSGSEPVGVHLKVDTGLHRVGANPVDVLPLARQIVSQPGLRLDAVWTHLATADEPDSPFVGTQLVVFKAVLDQLESEGLKPPLRHAANSAGLLAFPAAHFDVVRVGISIYGIYPSTELRDRAALRPALSLKARVTFVRHLDAGERVSYGLRYVLESPSTIATIPIGYGDGVPRNFSAVGGEVLVRGKRRRIAGTVTMDHLMIDMGSDPVDVGDEVVLIGRQGDEEITADEWADRLGTIVNEVVCRIGPRVQRMNITDNG